MSATGNILTGASAALTPIGLQTGSGAYCPKTLLKHANDLIFNDENQEGSALFGSRSVVKGVLPPEQAACPDGGTVTLNVTWTGPDNPQHCSQIVDPSLEFVFASCQEGTMTTNGSMTMSFVGNLCVQSPQAFSLIFDNFSYVDPTEPSDFTMNLSMDLSNIEYDGNGYIIGATTLLDGSINGTIDGTPVDLVYTEWTSTLSDVKYNASDEITEVKLTYDGSLEGSIDGDPVDESYDDLAFWFKESTVDSTTGIFFTINGKYDGPCTDGWANIETIENFFLPNSGICPTQGSCKISGVGEATVTCYTDGSLMIDVDGEHLECATCDDLELCI